MVDRTGREPTVTRELVLASDVGHSRLPNGYERLACVGLLPFAPGDGRVPLGVHYSGPYRDDYVSWAASLLGDPEHADQYFGRDPMAYRHQFTLGWIDSEPAAGPPGYVARPLNAYGKREHGVDWSGGYFVSTPAAVPDDLVNEVRVVDTTGYVFVDEETGDCGSYDGAAYQRVYLLSRTSPAYAPTALFASFAIQPDYSISPRWIRHTDHRYDIRNASPLVVMPLDEAKTPLMAFVLDEVAGGESASRLMIVNADSGETVDEISFSGRVSFTIPLVIGDDFVVTTADRSLVFFADEANSLARQTLELYADLRSRLRRLVSVN